MAQGVVDADTLGRIAEAVSEQLNLHGSFLGVEGAHAVAQLLGRSRALTTLNVRSTSLGPGGFRVLCPPLSVTTTLLTLNLGCNDLGNEGAVMVARVLAANPSLLHLTLYANRIGPPGAVALANSLKSNTTLQGLNLWRNRIQAEGAHAFAECLAWNSSLVSLNLEDTNTTSAAVKAFLSAIEKNTTLTKLNVSNNPVDLALLTKLERRLPTRHHRTVLLRYGKAPVSRVKLFLCGVGGVGKTTLVDSLKRAGRGKIFQLMGGDGASNRPSDRTNPEERTPGINVQVVSIHKQEFSVWDYAGQFEYYTTHEVFLADASAVFVVMCCLEDSEDVRRANLWYWLRFIKTRFDDCESAMPQIVLCGSHRDQCQEVVHEPASKQGGGWSLAWGAAVLEEMRQHFGTFMVFADTFFVLDCRKSKDEALESLSDCLCAMRQQIVADAPEIPLVCSDVLRSMPELRSRHGETMELDQFLGHVQKGSKVVLTRDVVLMVLRYLSDVGEVIWFEHDPSLHSVVVINPQWLCTRIIGPTLAPSSFQLPSLAHTILRGRVPLAHFHKLFSSPKDVALSILKRLDLCFHVEQPSILMFPATLQGGQPGDAWEPHEFFTEYLGRRLALLSDVDMFSAGFFPRLQVRLHALFGTSMVLWSNGLKGARANVECLVRMGGEGGRQREHGEEAGEARSLDVWVRTGRGNEMKLAGLLHEMLDLIESIRLLACVGTKVRMQALSLVHLRAHELHPAGYDMDILTPHAPGEGEGEGEGGHGRGREDAFVSPTDPPSNLQESVRSLLGPVWDPSQHFGEEEGQYTPREDELVLQDPPSMLPSSPSSVFIRSLAPLTRPNEFPFDPDTWHGPVRALYDVFGVWVTEGTSFQDKLQDLNAILVQKIKQGSHGPMQGGERDVFLSYDDGLQADGRTSNRGVARRVNDALVADFGWTTWFDEDQVLQGADEALVQAISRSIVVVVCVTRAYIQRVEHGGVEDLCRKQFTIANSVKAKSHMLVPLVLENFVVPEAGN